MNFTTYAPTQTPTPSIVILTPCNLLNLTLNNSFGRGGSRSEDSDAKSETWNQSVLKYQISLLEDGTFEMWMSSQSIYGLCWVNFRDGESQLIGSGDCK